jgi:uncharacterized protein
VLERDYCLAWFLVCLAATPLRHRLVFKGGTALKRCYFADYRFSEDLDFTLVEEVSFEVVRSELDSIFQRAQDAVGIAFRFLRYEELQNTHTFYIGFIGPLPTSQPKEIKVDVTIKESLLFRPVEREVLRGYEEFVDLPGGVTVATYALEEIAIEKVAALMDRARNEPRDLYDIWYLCDRELVRLGDLVPALEEKLRFRGKSIAGVRANFAEKEDRYRRLWSLRLDAQMSELPEFESTYRAVRRHLRLAGLG